MTKREHQLCHTLLLFLYYFFSYFLSKLSSNSIYLAKVSCNIVFFPFFISVIRNSIIIANQNLLTALDVHHNYEPIQLIIQFLPLKTQSTLYIHINLMKEKYNYRKKDKAQKYGLYFYISFIFYPKER